MTFGRDLFGLVFAQPIGSTNDVNQICAGSPIHFGRDFFDLVFAQSNFPRNNHPNQHVPKRTH